MSAGPQDSSVEQRRLQRRGDNMSFQIFPEPSEQLEPVQAKGGAARLERLPSIVVEPSEESEEESGGLQWPPLHTQASVDEEEEEEDPFQEHCKPNSGGQEEQTDADRVLHFKRSSIPCIQIDYSRLTPPPSPTSSHAAPPRFRS
ncbi:LBH-like protein [Labeo rohita]|nr:protein LBH-like [Labeo rohita]RXN18914.1 LBH-like protein [Labeo rohita]